MSAFDWNGYRTLAVELAKRTDEASQRSAISRAYYFVFNTARKRPSVSQYRFPEGEGVHKVLWDLYERNADKNCKSLAVLATRMKLRRVKADYDSFYPRIGEEVIAVLQDAEECATILQNLDPQYPKPIEKMWSY
jgi:uncharacterized protein (UPF0332 family)